MDTSISTDDAELAREFIRVVSDIASGQRPDWRNLDADLVGIHRRLHDAITTAGWYEVAGAGTGGNADLALLCEMVSGAGAVVPTPAYPLVEAFVARRALRALGRPDAATGTELLVTAVNLGLNLPGPSGTVVAPFADEAAGVLYAVADDDGGAELRQASGSGSTRLRRADLTRPLFTVEVSPDDDVLGVLEAAQLDQLRSEYVLLEAADMLGAADGLFRATSDHLVTRHQFGQPLASFQALSHRLVDLYVHLETLRSLVVYGGWVGDNHPELLAEFAESAKGYAAEYCWATANEAIQLHGAMGFTWEMSLQYPASRIIARALSTPSGEDCYRRAGERAVARGTMLALVE